MHRSLKRFAVWLLLVIAIFSALTACSLLFFKPYILLTVQADRRSDLLVFYDNGSRRGYCFDDAHLSQAYPLSAEKQTLKIHIPRGDLTGCALILETLPAMSGSMTLPLSPAGTGPIAILRRLFFRPLTF